MLSSKIAIGQYYPANSAIHALDPRVKLLGAIIFMTALFAANNGVGYAFAACFIFFLVFLSKVPVGFVFRGLKMIIYVFIFTGILNIFFSGGNTVLFHIWKLTATLEGVIIAGQVFVRLVLLIVCASLMTLTTSPIQLTNAMEKFLNPLRRIGFPAHEISMMTSIALRFIPTLLDEAEKIMKAQTARGADFENGGLIKKAKALIPLLVPLFISAFRRADELASAMEARCYRGGEGRTRMRELKYKKADFISFGILALYFGTMVFVGIFLRRL